MSPPARAMSPADLTDAQLGARALDGDRDAFTELFSRHESGLVNVAHRLTGSREDAADIAQEAFLRVFARLDDLAGREVNLAAYLHRTARNLVYDRTARRGREAPVDEIDRLAGADAALESDPQLAGMVGAQGEEVRAANARLPERHRLALALRELEGMGYEDIGRVLDITPGAVAQLLARARMGLRRELRLQQVDLEAMDPACRGRLGEIASLIDGELDPDRAHVLGQHLELCASCRAAREAFEDAGRRYRAWLPLPLLLGLGAETARAAEARRLVRFSGGGGRGPAAWRGSGGGGSAAGVLLGSRRRAAGAVGAGVLALGLLVAVPTLVATRSGSGSGAAPVAPVVAAATTVVAPTTAPAPTTTAAPPPRPRGTTTAPVPGPAPAPGPASAVAASPANPTTTGAVAPTAPPATTRTTVTTRRPRPAPPAATVTAAADPVAPPVSPPATGAPPPDPAADPPPTRTPAPPPEPNDPGPNDPPTTTSPPTRTTPPDIPFPTTFTVVRPPIAIP